MKYAHLVSKTRWPDGQGTQRLWDLELPLELPDDRITEQIRLLSCMQRDLFPSRPSLLDLSLPKGWSLSPPGSFNPSSWTHRLLSVQSPVTSSEPPFISAETDARMQVQAIFHGATQPFTAAPSADAAKLVLEHGALTVRCTKTTANFPYVYPFYHLFKELIVATEENGFSFELQPNGIAFDSAKLPALGLNFATFDQARVALEYNGAQNQLWLRLDAEPKPPLAARIDEQLRMIEAILPKGDAATDRPLWSSLAFKRQLQWTDLRWPVWIEKTTDGPDTRFALKLGLDTTGPTVVAVPGDAIRIRLFDQPPGSPVPAESEAEIKADFVTFTARPNGFDVGVKGGTALPITKGGPVYRYTWNGGGAAGPAEMIGVDPAFPPSGLTFLVEPGLRDRMADIRGDDAPVQRVFLPLDQGWLQCPVAALDPVAPIIQSGSSGAPGIISGELLLGSRRNERVYASDQPVSEMPWSLSLRHADGASGTWSFVLNGKTSNLQSVSLQLWGVKMQWRGLLWVAVGRPDDGDLLPRVEMGSRQFRDLVLTSIDGQGTTTGVAANLDAKFFAERQGTQRWPSLRRGQVALRPDKLPIGNAMDLVLWTRHPTLPAILAMPVTASEASPRQALASRELQPLLLRVLGTNDSLILKFSPDLAWPVLDNAPALATGPWWPVISIPPLPDEPHEGIPSCADGFPLVSLHLAGVEWWSAPAPAFSYRLDLPFVDEHYARARLPKKPGDEPAPPETPDLAVAPADALQQHFLARHDAWTATMGQVVRLRSKNGTVDARVPLGGWNWDNGKIDVTGTGLSQMIEISDKGGPIATIAGDRALAGPSAKIRLNGNTFTLDANTGEAQMTGWSVSTLRLNNSDLLWDSRGLGSQILPSAAANSTLLRRKLQIRTVANASSPVPTVSDCTLVSLTQPVELRAGGNDDLWTGSLWFRDLPFNGNDFDRKDASDLGPRPDVLGAYEWRWQTKLGETIDFKPLSLVKVSVDDQGVVLAKVKTAVMRPTPEVVLEGSVVLTFSRSGTNAFLSLTDVSGDELAWPLPDLSPERDRPSVLRLSLALDNKRNLTLGRGELETALLGNRVVLKTNTLPFWNSTLGFKFEGILLCGQQPTQLQADLDLSGKADKLEIVVKLQLDPAGTVELRQSWTRPPTRSSPVYTLTRGLLSSGLCVVKSDDQVDLRTDGGIALSINYAPPAPPAAKPEFTLLPQWKVILDSADWVIACTFTQVVKPGGTEAISLARAVIECEISGANSDPGHKNEPVRFQQQSLYGLSLKSDSGGWTHRVKMEGSWRLENAIKWPEFGQPTPDTTVLKRPNTSGHEITIRFPGLVMSPTAITVNPGQGLSLTLAKETWALVTHTITRDGQEINFDALMPIWIIPNKNELLRGLKARGDLTAFELHNKFAPLSQAASGFHSQAFQDALKALPDGINALWVLGMADLSCEFAGKKCTSLPLSLPFFWTNTDLSKSSDLVALLDPTGTYKGALGFDKPEMPVAESLDTPPPFQLVADRPSPTNFPVARWTVTGEVESPLSRLDSLAFSVAQSGARKFGPAAPSVPTVPSFLRQAWQIDLLFIKYGSPLRVRTWVAQKNRAGNGVDWSRIDPAMIISQTTKRSMFAAEPPSSDLVFVGLGHVAVSPDAKRISTTGSDANAETQMAFVASAAQILVGRPVAAYRRNYRVGASAFAALRIPANPDYSFVGTPLSPAVPDRQLGIPQAIDIPADILTGVGVVGRRADQDEANGFSSTQNWLVGARSAAAANFVENHPEDSGPLGWELTHEQVPFAAPLPASAVEVARDWPRDPNERIPKTHDLLTALTRRMTSEQNPNGTSALPFQSIFPPWQSALAISQRSGVYRVRSDRRIFASGAPYTLPDFRVQVGDGSSGLAQQYRAPRPVPLPANNGLLPDQDRRPRAAGINDKYRRDSMALYEGAADLFKSVPAPAGAWDVIVRLASPASSILDARWDGIVKLAFVERARPVNSGAFVDSWFKDCFAGARLRILGGDYEFLPPSDAGAPPLPALKLKTAPQFPPEIDEIEAELLVNVRRSVTPPVNPPSGTLEEPLCTLRFPLLYRSGRRYPTPFKRFTALFEDAVYNAELGSEVMVSDQGALRSDRRSYHFNDPLTLHYSVNATVNPLGPVLKFSRLRIAPVTGLMEKSNLTVKSKTAVPLPGPNGTLRLELSAFKETSHSEPSVVPVLKSGDMLVLQLDAMQPGASGKPPESLTDALQVPIVAEDSIAPPQAAYALWRAIESNHAILGARVPLAAWSPMPDRVELVDPENDLIAGRVRRYALFRWELVDTGPTPRCFLQKIDHTGASHSPEIDDEWIVATEINR